jgi:hypothetical protein
MKSKTINEFHISSKVKNALEKSSKKIDDRKNAKRHK